MKKRLLAIIVLLIILVGCTGKMQNGNGDIMSISDQNDVKEYIPPKMEGEISISTMNEDEYLTIAAQKFMSKYPNVKVIINSYMGTEDEDDTGVSKVDSMAVENYRNHLNTKIMTGKVEDIIFTGLLPVQKYINIGAFEDLSKFINLTPEINSDNYFMNVLEAPKDENGKIHTLPIRCALSIVSFNKQLVTDSNKKMDDGMTKISFEKAAEFAQQLVDNTNRKNTFLSLEEGAHFFNRAFNDYRNEFIDMGNKKANITDQYVTLLNHVKDLEEKGYFDTENSIDFYNMEYYFAFGIDFDMQAAFYSLLPDTYVYAMPLSDANGNVYLNPNSDIGISSTSKNKELAWEFVKFLLSDEVQSLPSFYGLGVNKKGLDASVERILKMYNDGNNEKVSKEAYKSLLEKWIMEINAYDTSDPIITDFVWEESKKFFDGKQSAEEAARILQAKIDKYFNE
ncbi:ABC transporter substrate-binding protein [Tissierella sp. MB52-C2]|uniref:ABC transporter substrate-binding protein n=1 Tax=Tissierella sp. MB52-C2 TaxID=3070999 RepID=UPI00280A708D|nr:ABC transporter substrate-binding protein [Tissierella sp. MB52-C2]WMM26352.1 ABC transporter substrate-binding protein [Tissierella sp. MB52-C2]